jgi:nanoRNase/pAp phosphatase (c-di-AMP/oligoRNAs hydrolase)
LLNFVLDPRTGLEEFKTYTVPRDTFMADLIAFCKRSPIHEILTHPDVEERVTTFVYHTEFAELQLSRCAKIFDKSVVIDFRNEEKRYPGNRFLVYGLFPDCSLSIQLSNTSKADTTEISLGKSIIERTSTVHLGNLMNNYGGGGHSAAGACRVDNARVDTVVGELLDHIRNA